MQPVMSAGCIVMSPNRSRLLPPIMQAFERKPGKWAVAVAPITQRLPDPRRESACGRPRVDIIHRNTGLALFERGRQE
jgi:hypothetical protein